jgi:putative DNA primase/helicase
MRQDFFTYVPQFKLLIAGNNKPKLRNVDEAMRRRLHLIPFTVTIPPAERDHTLGDKLRAELPGILAWMIKGCDAWRAQGLAPPAVVMQATDEYLAAEDTVARWLDEAGERDPNAWETTRRLWLAFSSWANLAGEHAGTERAFSESLEARGFIFHRKTTGRGFYGLRLATDSAKGFEKPDNLTF